MNSLAFALSALPALLVALTSLVASGALAAPACRDRLPEQERVYPGCNRAVLKQFAPELLAAQKLNNPGQKLNFASSLPCVTRHSMEGKGLEELTRFIQEDYQSVLAVLARRNIPRESRDGLRAALDECMRQTEKLHRLALEAARGVYRAKTLPGYEEPEIFDFKDTGVKAYLLMPKSPDAPAIIAFSGTEDLKDAAEDATWAVDQMVTAKTTFDGWVKWAYSRLKNRELIVTGHSLGGGLAQVAVAAMRPYEGDQIHLVTFNAFRGMDSFYLLAKKLGHDPGRLLEKNFEHLADAVHYRMDNDPVSQLGNDLGGQVRTLTLPKNENPSLLRQAVKTFTFPFTQALRVMEPPAAALFAHSLKNFPEALKQNPRALIESCPESGSFGAHPIGAAGRGLRWLVDTVREKFRDQLQDAKLATTLFLSEHLNDRKAKNSPNGAVHDLEKKRTLLQSCQQGKFVDCNDLGYLLQNQGNYAEAKEAFALACKADPWGCEGLHQLLVQTGQLKEAAQASASSCMRQNGGYLFACIDAAQHAIEAGDMAQARTYFTRACETDYRPACRWVRETAAAKRHFTQSCAKLESPSEAKDDDFLAPNPETRNQDCFESGYIHFLEATQGTPARRAESLATARGYFERLCDRKVSQGCDGLAMLQASADPSPAGIQRALQLLESKVPVHIGKKVQAIKRKRTPSDFLDLPDLHYRAALYERLGDQEKARTLHEINCFLQPSYVHGMRLSCLKLLTLGSSYRTPIQIQTLLCHLVPDCQTNDNTLTEKTRAWIRSQTVPELQHFPGQPYPSLHEIPSGVEEMSFHRVNRHASPPSERLLYQKSQNGVMPLTDALYNQQPETVDQLLAEGYDPRRDPGAMTAAITDSAEPVIRVLVHRGLSLTDPRIPDPPLVTAAEHAPELFKLLVQEGAAVHAYSSRSRRNALETAIDRGAPDAVRELLALGADPDRMNPYTGKPAWKRAEENLAAPPKAVDWKNSTPQARQDILRILREHRAKSVRRPASPPRP